MTEKFSNFKREVGEILKRLFSKLTPRQGKCLSLIVSAIIALLFLCTVTGRSVIVFMGYLIFAYVILLFAYKFFKFASTHSIAEPKSKKAEVLQNDDVPDVIENDADSGIHEDIVTEEENEKEHQITIEELQQEVDNGSV